MERRRFLQDASALSLPVVAHKSFLLDETLRLDDPGEDSAHKLPLPLLLLVRTAHGGRRATHVPGLLHHLFPPQSILVLRRWQLAPSPSTKSFEQMSEEHESDRGREGKLTTPFPPGWRVEKKKQKFAGVSWQREIMGKMIRHLQTHSTMPRSLGRR